MNTAKKATYLMLALIIIAVPLYCFRAGSFFGGMAAGGLLGGLVGNSIGKQNRQDVVYVQPEQPRVVYVKDAPQMAPSEAERLRQENEELRARLDRLEKAQKGIQAGYPTR